MTMMMQRIGASGRHIHNRDLELRSYSDADLNRIIEHASASPKTLISRQ